jgi:hypothetical protein
MHLCDYLHDIPLKLLKRIAERLGITAEYQARIKLMNAVDSAFRAGTLVPRMVGSLSPEAKRVLSIVAFSFDSGVEGGELSRLTGADPESAVFGEATGELILAGMIAGITDGETRFFCPRGPAEQVRRLLLGEVVAWRDPAEPLRAEMFPVLVEDVYALLAAVYRGPLPLTLKGGVRKNAMEKVYAGSPVGKEPRSRFTEAVRDDFVLAYLDGRGLLVYGPKTVGLSPKFGGWLGMSVTERVGDIAAFALAHFLSDEQAAAVIAGIFGELPAGSSFDPAGFAAFLGERTPADRVGSRLRGRMQNAFHALEYLGLLRFHEGLFTVTETGELLFCGGKHPLDGALSRTFLLQPNFEVILGPELDPGIRFTIELMSERRKRDIILTTIVTRAGIARARERGMSAAEVLGFFETHSRIPLPQNVRYSIETWAGEYGNVSFEPVMLMRFRDKAACDSAAHIPQIAPFVRERISDTALAVQAEKVRFIAVLLRKAGYLPEISGETVEDPARSDEPFHASAVGDLSGVPEYPEHRWAFVAPALPEDVTERKDIP